jgi:hypothetical protein
MQEIKERSKSFACKTCYLKNTLRSSLANGFYDWAAGSLSPNYGIFVIPYGDNPRKTPLG